MLPRAGMDVYVPSNPNTVQLDAEDGGDGWSGGLGPVTVVGAFDVPSGHFAFDQSRVGSLSSDGVEALTQQFQGAGPAVVTVLRGENRALVTANGVRCGGR
jgi:hypothetical protein